MRCEDNEIIAWFACKYIFPALGFVIGILRIMMSNMYPYWSIFCWCIYTMLFLTLWHCKYRFAKCLAWLMIPLYLIASGVIITHGLGYFSENLVSILTESAHQAAPLIFIGVVVGIICYKILSFLLKNK